MADEFTAELFSVGTELTLGRIQDTNSSWMAARLSSIGAMTRRITVLCDDLPDMVEALQSSLRRSSSLIIVTGGLGPTPDDLTVDAICLVAGLDKVVSELIVEDYMRRREIGREEVNPNLLKMATVPVGAEASPNPAGWAPCIRLTVNGATIFALAGPPKEMEAVFEAYVAPFVSGHLTWRTHSLRLVVDMFESEVSPVMEEVMAQCADVYLKAYVALRGVSSDWLPVDIVAGGPDLATSQARLHDAERLFTELVRAQGKGVAPFEDAANGHSSNVTNQVAPGEPITQ